LKQGKPLVVVGESEVDIEQCTPVPLTISDGKFGRLNSGWNCAVQFAMLCDVASSPAERENDAVVGQISVYYHDFLGVT
jgi:hypothetical protein